MSQRAQDLCLAKKWHAPAVDGPLRSACGEREAVMRGDKTEEQDHRLTRNPMLWNCDACVEALP